MFSLYGNTAGTPTPVLTCPSMRPACPPAAAPTSAHSPDNSDSENLISSRSTTRSTQTTASGIGSSRTPDCRQRTRSDQRHLQLVLAAAAADACCGLHALVHANLVNQFTPGQAGIRAYFCRTITAHVSRPFPLCCEAVPTRRSHTIAAIDQTYTQGRKVTQWQINDNLIWTRGTP